MGLKYLCVTTALAFATSASGVPPDDYNAYRYKLEKGANVEVCKHMEAVYNREFRHPWGRFEEQVTRLPEFPRLSGVEYDERIALDLRYSTFPTSPEFDAIQWHEGRGIWDEERKRVQPFLVADFDIDNDGRSDRVVKIGFMLTFWPAGRSVPGGEDELFVFDEDQVDLTRTVVLSAFYRYVGQRRPARVAYDTLGLAARSIRPFVHKGVTYLSVYEQLAEEYPKPYRETMWVLRYRGGGANLGGGKWEPVKADRVCRFKMIAMKPF
jgi:hypothetical protein